MALKVLLVKVAYNLEEVNLVVVCVVMFQYNTVPHMVKEKMDIKQELTGVGTP